MKSTPAIEKATALRSTPGDTTMPPPIVAAGIRVSPADAEALKRGLRDHKTAAPPRTAVPAGPLASVPAAAQLFVATSSTARRHKILGH